MKHKIILIILFVFSIKLYGFDGEKYCGSGWSKNVVPDEFMGCKFSDACKEHDMCYGRCDKDGDRFGSAYCKLPESSPERTESKQRCDANLESKINEINNDIPKCKKFAALYKIAVDLAGQGPFNGKEASDLMVKIIDTSKTEAEVVQKAILIHNLSISGKIDPSSFKLSSADEISFNLNRPTDRSELIQNDKLILKKGVNIDKLRALNADKEN